MLLPEIDQVALGIVSGCCVSASGLQGPRQCVLSESYLCKRTRSICDHVLTQVPRDLDVIPIYSAEPERQFLLVDELVVEPSRPRAITLKRIYE
jgi:hypothetical protein